MSTLKAKKRRVRRRSAKKRVRRTKGKKKRRKGGDPKAVVTPSRETPATVWQCNPSTKGLYVNNERDAGFYKRHELAMRRKDDPTFYNCMDVKDKDSDHYRSCNVAGCYVNDPNAIPENDAAFIKAYYARKYNKDTRMFEDPADIGGRRKSRRRRRRRRKKSKQSKKRRRRKR